MSTIKRQTSFKIHQPVDVMFPLFSAEGEKYWVPGWEYENVMGGGTDLHEDYVFLTAGHDTHGHSGSEEPALPKTVWLVKTYQPENYFVQFYRVEPEEKVAIITVQCKPLADDLTEVEVAYEYIGLSEKGDDFIAHYSEESHVDFIGHWHEALAHYFEA